MESLIAVFAWFWVALRIALFVLAGQWAIRDLLRYRRLRLEAQGTAGRKGETTMRLDVRAFAIAGAIVGGLGLFILTWWVIAFEGSTGEPTVIGMVYRGYRISPAGSLMGLVWGALDGLIGGAVFAWLYNWLGSREHLTAPTKPL